ncbi:MAG: hypothetical protein Q7S29_03220 [Candidatus Peribacter sp.]|nr:hypothetical protein [Candidatus Peribacter sp.]
MQCRKFLLSAPVYASILLVSCIAGVSIASAATLYWRGNYIGSTARDFEDPVNWSTTLGGTANTPTAPGSADTAVLYLSRTGSTMVIHSHASVQGLVINKLYTGSLLLGTGSLNVGSAGVRMGSGRLIGSGHLLGDSSDLSIAGGFTMTGGVVRLGATNLYLSGSLAISKGVTSSYTQFVSTGSIVFNSRTADQNFTVGSTVNNTYFKNLTLNNTAGTTDDDIVVSGTPLKLSGALLITQGNLDLDTNNVALQVESGITLAANAQATLTSDANVTASGHIVAGAGAAFVMSTNTLTLNGKNQNFDTNNSPLYNLTVAPSGTVTLTSDQSVTGTLQVNAGSTLDLNGFTIYATGATITNEGTITEGAGKIIHSATTAKITDSTYTEDDSFTTDDTLYFTLTDSDENISGTAADTVSVTVSVTIASGDSETVTLTETSNTSGIFRGSIPSAQQNNSAAIVANNGYLETPSTASISLSFTDAQDSSDTGSDTASLALATASTTTTTTTSNNSGSRRGSSGGGGGSAGASTLRGIVPVKTVAPKPKTTPPAPGLTLKERAELRKSARVTRMQERAAARAALRRAARK